MNSTVKDVLNFINDNDVKFIRLGFCDPFGVHKNISIMASELAKAFENGIPLHGGSIRGFCGEERGSLLLFPDPTTLTVLPWRPGPGRVVRFYCFIKDANGKDYFGDTRLILCNMLKRFEEQGFRCKIGTDCEFYLFKTDDSGEATYDTLDLGGFCDIAPLDKGENIRREICLNLEEMGLQPEVSHHEKGPGQNEIDFKYSDSLNAADNFLTFRSVVKAISARNGLYASFMPKPLAGEAGSGLRLNIVLENNKTNNTDFAKEADNFVAGIIKKAGKITLFLNPTINSFNRLSLNSAPSVVSRDGKGVNPFVRVLERNENSMLIELCSPDCTINPYLAFSLIIGAGLYGVERKISLEEAAAQYDLPKNLTEAIEVCGGSKFVSGIVGEELLASITAEKTAECNTYQSANDKEHYITRHCFNIY